MNEEGQIQSSTKPNNHAMMRSFQVERYFTSHRAELLSWFQRNAPSLGELYWGALRMIYESPFPGRTRFVSYAIREIRNRMPDIISGVKGPPALQYVNKLDEISKAWEKTGFPSDGSLPISFTSSEKLPSSSILVPRRLLQRISALIKEHNDAREKPIDAAKRLFSGITPENLDLGDSLRPVVNQWLTVTEWFVRKVHDSGRVDNDIDAEEFESKFEVFEISLGALLRGFFTTIEELDEILEDANF
jgi:hypothetical protein